MNYRPDPGHDGKSAFDDHVRVVPWGSWKPADHSKLKVRGPTYLDDKVKVIFALFANNADEFASGACSAFCVHTGAC